MDEDAVEVIPTVHENTQGASNIIGMNKRTTLIPPRGIWVQVCVVYPRWFHLIFQLSFPPFYAFKLYIYIYIYATSPSSSWRGAINKFLRYRPNTFLVVRMKRVFMIYDWLILKQTRATTVRWARWIHSHLQFLFFALSPPFRLFFSFVFSLHILQWSLSARFCFSLLHPMKLEEISSLAFSLKRHRDPESV